MATRRKRDGVDAAELAKAGQLTWLDEGEASATPEQVATWERERKRSRPGRPTESRTGARRGDGERDRRDRGSDDAGMGAPGARMRRATPGVDDERVDDPPWWPDDREAWTPRPQTSLAGLEGGRVARSDVAAAIRGARGRISDPEHWTPLHLAASRLEGDGRFAWWNRWPVPWSPAAVRWCAVGAVMATCPDMAVQRLALVALEAEVNRVELTEGHAATLQYMEERAAMVDGIEARYLTAADILAAVARLPASGRGRAAE